MKPYILVILIWTLLGCKSHHSREEQESITRKVAIIEAFLRGKITHGQVSVTSEDPSAARIVAALAPKFPELIPPDAVRKGRSGNWVDESGNDVLIVSFWFCEKTASPLELRHFRLTSNDFTMVCRFFAEIDPIATAEYIAFLKQNGNAYEVRAIGLKRVK